MDPLRVFAIGDVDYIAKHNNNNLDIVNAVNAVTSAHAVVPVQLTTTAALPANTYNSAAKTLTGNANGALANVDSTPPTLGYRYLVKDEAAQSNNGIYVLTQVGDVSHPYVLTRAPDFSISAQIAASTLVIASLGSRNSGLIFLLETPLPIVLDTTALAFLLLPLPYDVPSFFSGVPTADRVIGQMVFGRTVIFLATLPGSAAASRVAATASTVIDIRQNGVSRGSVTFALGATVGTFTFAGAIVFVAGDVLSLVAQHVPDATLADISITLAGRTP